MKVFPYMDHWYVDILTKCMSSDIHCPIYLVRSRKPTVSIKESYYQEEKFDGSPRSHTVVI